MAKRKNRELLKRRESGAYLAVPHVMLRSHTRSMLSPKACKLLLDMWSQFNSFNNGDICITWKLMKARNWRSKETLNKARKELLEKGFIETSRYGGLNRASLYALTSWAVDECQGKLSIRSTNTPKSLWKKHEPEKKEKMPERFVD